MSDRIAHQPVERRARVVAAELALTAGTAYLVGLCVTIAAATDQAPGVQLVLAAAGIGLVLSYGMWLLGGSGVPLAALNLPLLVLATDALLVATGFLDLGSGSGLLGPGLTGIVPPLLAVAAAATGLVCGLVIPGPRRLRLTHGVHRQQVNTSALLSEGAVMERLRTARAVTPAAPKERDPLWFDDSTEEDHLLPPNPAPEPTRAAQTYRPAEPVPQPDPDPGPEADPGPDPMPAPDPMPDPDPMPEPDADRFARWRTLEDSSRAEQHLQ